MESVSSLGVRGLSAACIPVDRTPRLSPPNVAPLNRTIDESPGQGSGARASPAQRRQPDYLGGESAAQAPTINWQPLTLANLESQMNTATNAWSSQPSEGIWLPSLPSPAAVPVRLTKVAENASILLELFSQSCPDDDDDIDHDQQTMIACAADEIAVIQTRIRQSVARRNGDISPRGEAEKDADCIICYNESADTVFMPCKHLVVCTVRTLPLLCANGCVGGLIAWLRRVVVQWGLG